MIDNFKKGCLVSVISPDTKKQADIEYYNKFLKGRTFIYKAELDFLSTKRSISMITDIENNHKCFVFTDRLIHAGINNSYYAKSFLRKEKLV